MKRSNAGCELADVDAECEDDPHPDDQRREEQEKRRPVAGVEQLARLPGRYVQVEGNIRADRADHEARYRQNWGYPGQQYAWLAPPVRRRANRRRLCAHRLGDASLATAVTGVVRLRSANRNGYFVTGASHVSPRDGQIAVHHLLTPLILCAWRVPDARRQKSPRHGRGCWRPSFRHGAAKSDSHATTSMTSLVRRSSPRPSIPSPTMS